MNDWCFAHPYLTVFVIVLFVFLIDGLAINILNTIFEIKARE